MGAGLPRYASEASPHFLSVVYGAMLYGLCSMAMAIAISAVSSPHRYFILTEGAIAGPYKTSASAHVDALDKNCISSWRQKEPGYGVSTVYYIPSYGPHVVRQTDHGA